MDVDQLRAVFERVEEVLSKQIFFIAGAPKSGTTWLQRLLDAHPEIACSGEGHFADKLAVFFRHAIADYNRQQKLVAQRVYENDPIYPELSQRELDLTVVILSSLIMSTRPLGEHIRCVGDKTPRYTFHMEYLKTLFPDAKFIHVIRDGRDVVVSTCYHVYRTGDHSVFEKDSANFHKWVRQFAKQWFEAVSAARRFGEGHAADYFEVRFEDLLAQPAPKVRELLGFLGVDAAEATVRDCQERASFESLSGGRPRGQEVPSSFFRKGVSGDWRAHFDDGAVRIFEAEAGGLLEQLGYGGDEG